MVTTNKTRKWPGALIPVLVLLVAWVAGSCGGGAGAPAGGPKTPPAAPAVLQASKGLFPDRVRVNWQASAGATIYQVFRSPNNAPNSYTELSGTISSTFYDDFTVQTGQTFYYYVKAGNAAGYSGASATDGGYLQGSPPAPPFNLTASDGQFNDRIRVSWAAAEGADSYELFRDTSPTGSFTTAVCLKQPVPTPPLCILPGPASPNPARNLIDDGAPFPADPDASNLPVSTGVTYYYKIRAHNIYGWGQLSSSPESGFANANPPAPPVNVVASKGDFTDRIRVNWTAAQGATGYKVVWAPASSGPYNLVFGIPLPGGIPAGTACPIATAPCQFDDMTPPPAAVDIFYRVIATNGNGDSAQSSFDSGWLAPPFPACVVASGSQAPPPPGCGDPIAPAPDHVEISWMAVLPSQPGLTVQYEVLKSLTQNGIYASIGVTTSTTFDDPVTPAQPTFYYKVRTLVNGKASALSGAVDGTTQAQPPLPTSVTCVQAGGRANAANADKGLPCPAEPAQSTDNVPVTWNTNAATVLPYVFSYRVFRGTNQNGPFEVLSDVPVPIPATPPASMGFTDTTAVSGVNYYYLVRAQNSQGFSPVNGFTDEELGWRLPGKPLCIVASGTIQNGAPAGCWLPRPIPPVSQTSVTIKWDPVPGFSQYKVYRNLCAVFSPACPLTEIATTSNTTYDDVNPPGPQGTVYFYRVATFAGVHISDYSEPDSGFATNVPPTPPPPINVQATDGTFTAGFVRITWDPVAGADFYQVGRSSFAAGPFNLISGNVTGTFFDDNQTGTPLIIGQTFYYVVRSGYNPNLTGLYSSPDTGYSAGTPPPAPGSFHATDPFSPNPLTCPGVGCGDGPAKPLIVSLTWNAIPGIPATNYLIYRSRQPNMTPPDFPGGASVPGAQTYYDDNSVTPGVTYFYQVQAVTGSGPGPLAPSPPIGETGATLPPNLTAPPSINATDGDPQLSGFVEITWPCDQNLCSTSVFYRLYRSQSAFGPFLQVGADLFPTTDPAQYCPEDTRLVPPKPDRLVTMCYEDKIPPDGNVNPGQLYWYKAQACNTFNCSPLSTVQNDGFAFVANTAPLAPVGVTITPRPVNGGGTSMVVSWTANTELNLDHYEIYKATAPPVPQVNANRVGTVNKFTTSYTDSRACTNGNLTDLQQVCYGGLYYYRVVAANTSNLSSSCNPATQLCDVGAYANPPYKAGAWPRGAGSWVKSSSITGDFSIPADNTREIAGADNSGRVSLFTPGGGNFGGTGAHPATWPITATEELVSKDGFFGDRYYFASGTPGLDCFPPLPFQNTNVPPGPVTQTPMPFLSSPAVGRLLDDTGSAAGAAHLCQIVYDSVNEVCFTVNPQFDGNVEQQVVIGGQDAVYVFRAEGRSWGGSPDQLAAELTTHQLGYLLGTVTATPLLLDVVNLQGNAGADGYPEVAAASEAGIVAIWRFRDLASPVGIGFFDNRPDDQFLPYVNTDPENCPADDGWPENPAPMELYTPPFVRGFPVSVGAPVRASPAVADIGRPNMSGGPDGFLDLLVASTNGCMYAFDASGRTGLSGQPIFGFPVCPASAFRSSPSVADFNADGCPEMVLGGDDGNIYLVADGDGTCDGTYSFQYFQTGAPVESSPAFADLNGDSFLDAVIGSDNGRVYAFDGLASYNSLITGGPAVLLAGWPFQTDDLVRASPSIADVDNQGIDTNGDTIPDVFLDVIAGSFDGKLYALYPDGKKHRHDDPFDPLYIAGVCEPRTSNPDNRCAIVNGWPVDFTQPIASTTVVDNVDPASDAYLEITVGGDDMRFHTLSLNPAPATAVRWPAFRKNRLRTGACYDPPLCLMP